MNAADLQTEFFAQVRLKLGPAAPLVDEVAATLNVSSDSAYRRIRGDKFLSFDELYLLCTRFGISLDGLMGLQTGVIPFQGKFIDPATFRFQDYLAAVGGQVKYMASHRQREMLYLCKDIPLFHHYQFKPLAAFKYFFWHRTFWQSPEFDTRKVLLKDYPDEVFETGRAALAVYNQLDSYEIWNMESLNGTLRQVEYYHDTQAFSRADDLLQVYDALDNLFTHLELQAERGYKFDSEDAMQKRLGAFHMYYNEVVIGDNSILAVLDGVKHCFITHTGVNFMLTRDLAFCENMYNYYQNLMRKSTLISTVSERERSRFFKVLRNRIAARKENLRG